MKITLTKETLLKKLEEGKTKEIKKQEANYKLELKTYEKEKVRVDKLLLKYIEMIETTGELSSTDRYSSSVYIPKVEIPQKKDPKTSDFDGAINLIKSIKDEEITFDLNRDKFGIATVLRKALGY